MKIDPGAFELVSIDGEMALVIRLGRPSTDPVPSFERVKRTYRYAEPERDTVSPFLAHCTIRVIGARYRVTPFYKAYSDWCAETGEEKLTRRAFRQAMIARGFSTIHSNGSHWRDLAPVGAPQGSLL
ncbi:primase-like DNA-binding domain-containing protein [Erythrobacter sp. A6_0]|uniref:primase-like DNA-binding domain-containing protein n=1 Tax=Erythrobacter sp. A6_0 TaxID=2821089 RepID=UPI001ADC4248|nr:primase-like DNA-binding domain-containing protein [Erythrobacter sp. A6_0]MBO9510929.1 hypothetical protein [Erythrobacter sp. A6_0]